VIKGLSDITSQHKDNLNNLREFGTKQIEEMVKKYTEKALNQNDDNGFKSLSEDKSKRKLYNFC